MRNYSINWGKLLFIRWLPISWTLQAVHVLDTREKIFRIILELIPMAVIAALAVVSVYSWWMALGAFIVLHTLFWLFDSTWLVGFREVYTGFRGKGIQSVIDFVDWSLEELKDCDNISAIAIYGSICRHKYHDRSDFDLRILQERSSLKTYFKMIKLRTVGIWKYKIPMDLKLVDSVDFLKKEMRDDEHPIVPFNKYESFYNEGDSFSMLKANPHDYHRDKEMKIINFLWHYSTGGIGKCFLTYDKLEEVEPNLHVKSVCVILDNVPCDFQPLVTQGIEIIHIKGNSDFSWMKRMKEIVRKEKPDAFFCHGFNGPIMLYLFKNRYFINTPMICTCHGVNLDKTNRLNKYIDKLWMYIYRRKMVKKVVCVEQFTPHVLREKGIKKEKLVTVYNGIDPAQDEHLVNLSTYKINTPVIITASRLTRIKGLNYLIDALATLKIKGVKFCYFCIGNGEEELALKAQAKDRGLTNQDIHFIGYQNNVPEWLAACDIFALPSLEEFHSIAILEAMRAKKAIVATNIGGNPESLRNEKDALMVPSMDAYALADALERLLTSVELRKNLAENANKRFLEKFTIDVMKKNLVREIMSVKNIKDEY